MNQNLDGMSLGEHLVTDEKSIFRLLDCLDEAALILDENHRVMLSNDAARRVIGRSEAELVGKTILDVAPKQQAQHVLYKEEEALESGMPSRYVGPLSYSGNRELDSKTLIPFVVAGSGRKYLLVIIRTVPAETAQAGARPDAVALARRLDDVETALRVVLERREAETAQATDAFSEKLKSTLSPYIEQLKQTKLGREQQELVGLMENNLNRLIDSQAAKLSSSVFNLTPMEVQVAHHVRDGKTNKEIAAMMNLSKSTILTHRHHIRVKLGLKNNKKNLRTFLLSL